MSTTTKHDARASFDHMAASTQDDWQMIGAEFVRFAGGLADRVLRHLALLDGDYGGVPGGPLTPSPPTAPPAHLPRGDEGDVGCALLPPNRGTPGTLNPPANRAAVPPPLP